MYSDLEQYLILFADCIVSKGYVNNVIYDFKRTNNSNLIPCSYVEFLETCRDYCLKEVYEKYKEDKLILDEYVEFTLDNEYGFICDASLKDSFPSIFANINSPEYIDNCIIVLSSIEESYLYQMNAFFDALMVNSLEIRLDEANLDGLVLFEKYFSQSCIESISIYIDQFYNFNDYKIVNELVENNPRINKIVICNQNQTNKFSIKLQLTTNSLFDLLNIQNEVVRNINLSYHLESKKYNPYLYKKLFIGKEGEIKNSEELDIIGYIQDVQTSDELIKIVQSNVFQKLWETPKNKIQVCKDCEFNSVCFDTRIPQKTIDNGEYYFNEECSYNPYIGKTKGEEGYRTLSECGVISNEDGFSVDHEKIAEINRELWEEEIIDN